MQCERFEHRLHRLLDKRLDPQIDQPLILHSLKCSRCRQTLAAFTALQDGLDLSDPPAMSANFTQRVVNLAMDLQRPWRRRTSAALLAAAAVALLVVGIRAVVPPAKPPSTSTTAAKLKGHLSPRSQHQRTAVAQSQSIDDVASASRPNPHPNVHGLFRETTNLLSFPEIPTLEHVSQQFDSDMIPGVRPITSSLSVAISLLRRAFPGAKTNESQQPQAGNLRGHNLQNLS